MKLEGSYEVKAPREKVWNAFLDPATLQKAIPGCEKLELIGADEYKATLKIGVAAVKEPSRARCACWTEATRVLSPERRGKRRAGVRPVRHA